MEPAELDYRMGAGSRKHNNWVIAVWVGNALSIAAGLWMLVVGFDPASWGIPHFEATVFPFVLFGQLALSLAPTVVVCTKFSDRISRGIKGSLIALSAAGLILSVVGEVMICLERSVLNALPRC